MLVCRILPDDLRSTKERESMRLAEQRSDYTSRVTPHPVVKDKVRASLVVLNKMNTSQVDVLLCLIDHITSTPEMWGLREAFTPQCDKPDRCAVIYEWPGPPPPAYRLEEITPAYAEFYRQP